MRLTKQTNYAVCALIYCAVNEPALSRVKDLADAYQISEQFLFKILTPLIKAGLLESVRGRRGGMRLAVPARQINLAEVLKLTEDNFLLFEEIEANGRTDPAKIGRYGFALQEALAAFNTVLARYSVADLADDPTQLTRLLGLDQRTEQLTKFSLLHRKKVLERLPK